MLANINVSARGGAKSSDAVRTCSVRERRQDDSMKSSKPHPSYSERSKPMPPTSSIVMTTRLAPSDSRTGSSTPCVYKLGLACVRPTKRSGAIFNSYSRTRTRSKAHPASFHGSPAMRFGGIRSEQGQAPGWCLYRIAAAHFLRSSRCATC